MIKRLQKKLDADGKEILSKGIVTFILKVLGVGLAFLLQFIIARKLGASGSGIYFLALNLLLLLATITRLGMDNSVTRFVAAYASEHNWASVTGVTQLALRITLGISLPASIILYWLAEPIVNWFDKPELLQALQGMLLLTVPLAVMTILAKAIQGLKRARDTMLMQSVITPLFACIFVLILAPEFGISGAVAAYGIGVLATLAYGTYCWQNCISQYKSIKPGFEARILIKTSLPMMGALIMQQISQSLPLIVLGYWASNADVGIFGAAQRTAALVSLVLIAANIIVAPKLSELYHRNDMAGLGKVSRQGALFMTAMSSPILLLCLAVPEWILGLFGPEFSEGWLLLVIMALGQLVNVMTGSVSFLLMMTGQEKSLLSANIFSALLCTLLSLILIPAYGATGAAIAVAIPIAAVNLIRVHFIWKKMGIIAVPWF